MKLPYALTAFGLPHTMGYLRTLAGDSHPAPLDLTGLMDRAGQMGLAGIEAPLPIALDTCAVRDALDERGLRIILDWGNLLETTVEDLENFLRNAAALDATIIRATLSSVLCGDRRPLARPWKIHLDALAKRLRDVLPRAAEVGITIAVENHQDATSEDLLILAEKVNHHPAFGVTLDTGNPLAVGEDPEEYARQVAPLVRHLHLKDYTLHFAPEGYRLVRCAAGEGVIDFPSIFKIVDANKRQLLPGIEIAAQATRTISILDPGWWEGYHPLHATRLRGALALLWQKGQPVHIPYSSAWERGEGSAQVSAEEWELVERSVEYFRQLGAMTASSNDP